MTRTTERDQIPEHLHNGRREPRFQVELSGGRGSSGSEEIMEKQLSRNEQSLQKELEDLADSREARREEERSRKSCRRSSSKERRWEMRSPWKRSSLR